MIKVSVLLIAYNQENYIKTALESILMQKTDFFWELLIGEDASTDNTAGVIKESIVNIPPNCTVVPCLREENIGASKNLFDLIRKAKGEYITVLEGDDYWLDENRLQTLVDFLDENSQYVGVSYKRERRLDDQLIKYDPDEQLVDKTFTVDDYFNGKRFSAMACLDSINWPAAMDILYTKDYDGYEYLYTGARNACDQIMCYTILFSGDVFILNKVFGVYRVASGGYCSQQKQLNRINDYLVQNRRLIQYYGEISAIKQEICQLHAEALKIFFREFKVLKAINYYNAITHLEKKGVLSALFDVIFSKITKRRT